MNGDADMRVRLSWQGQTGYGQLQLLSVCLDSWRSLEWGVRHCTAHVVLIFSSSSQVWQQPQRPWAELMVVIVMLNDQQQATRSEHVVASSC